MALPLITGGGHSNYVTVHFDPAYQESEGSGVVTHSSMYYRVVNRQATEKSWPKF